ncbi:phosphate ABC transporter permease subunit PstC [Rhizobium sp. CFBP 8762]|uniref:phosphate ABC transporter permease subunit PstC n=1 Tax=Rhizobium sp. CFBP 8762 TaxID=2775279 RepID=UPI001785F15A|nr:phosphate ABC transporter permease subunit PstC [Rhizobium sp. CFBP 8762]MBD8553598.1 phosphate ABC transporter permease subunit PstC [Rhizobium sp. CFBP 8762]
MTTSAIIMIIIGLGIVTYLVGRARAVTLSQGKLSNMHSRPVYYGAYAAICAMLPALAVLVVWLIAAPIVVEKAVKTSLSETTQEISVATGNLTFGTVRAIAGGLTKLTPEELARAKAGEINLREILGARGVPLASETDPAMVAAAEDYNALNATSRMAMTGVVLLVGLLGAAFGLRRIAARFRARNGVERVILVALIAASCIAILTTVGIVGSMLSETLRFFASVSPSEFFFGTVWDPRFSAAGNANSAGQFGLLPLLAGTLYIAFVAMLFAVPIGLFAAIYMAEYASPMLRSTAKPLLEVLAGIPSIVYGFFALITVGPFLRDLSANLNGLVTGNYQSFIQAQSVLTAGLVMGIMLIPFVSSLSDDIITQVPRAMRDGSLGLGATRSETIKRVILPAALPGIVGALLLTASRAVGETMIVVLAAGVAARMQLNPFEPMTTVTVKIVNQLTGDLEFTSPQTLVAFALGITLFVITLCLNIYALYIVRKYREQYE